MDVQERDPQARGKRRGFMLAALVVIACIPVDWLQLGHFSWLTLSVRLLWAGLVAGFGWYMPMGGPRFHAWAGSAGAVASAVALGLLALLTGGVDSGVFHWMLAMPLAVVALIYVDVRAVVWVSVVCVAWTLGLSLQAGVGTARVIEWSLMQVATGTIAVWSATALRRLINERDEEARARTEALTRLALSEKQRVQSEQLAIVGRLAAGVAHEVNNPLAYVRANLGCLEESHRDADAFTEEEVRELFEESRDGLDRIRQIVSDLRTFSRTDPLTLVPFELPALVDEAVRMAKVRLKNVAQIQVHLHEGLPRVLVHERHFVQVVLNLLVNAADALEEAKMQGAQVWVHAQQRDDAVEISVEDNGPGLPESTLQRLFEPFFTTKAPGRGTGLGLPLSREYVAQMSGTLIVGARPGGGARFTITLPAAQEPIEVPEIVPARPQMVA